MAIIPAGFGQANFKFTGDGFPTGAEVTWGFQNETPQTAAECAADFVTAYTGELLEVTPQAVTLASVLLKLGPNDTGPQVEVAVNSPGTGSPAEVQPNMSALVQKRTALGGRRNRGRVFWPVAEDAIDTGGAVDAAVLAVLQAQFDSFFSAIDGLACPLVILHSTGDPTPETVTGLFVQSLAATQRRRLRR
jgi:hypothetical protein